MRGLTILCYHRVTEDGRPTSFYTSSIGREQFLVQMEYLRKGFRILALEEALDLLATGKLPDGAVSITFDDGYEELETAAFPILWELGLPATVFLVVGHVGSAVPFWWEEIAFRAGFADADWLVRSLRGLGLDARVGQAGLSRALEGLKAVPAERRRHFLEALRRETPEVIAPRTSLDWEAVRRAGAHGISFGSHTMTHPVLTNLDDETLREELVTSQRILDSMTGFPCRVLAYPHGAYDGRVRRATLEAGYRWALTMERGTNRSWGDALALRRHPVYAHHGRVFFQALMRGWLNLPPSVFGVMNASRRRIRQIVLSS